MSISLSSSKYSNSFYHISSIRSKTHYHVLITLRTFVILPLTASPKSSYYSPPCHWTRVTLVSCFSNVPRMFPSQGLSFVWTLVSCPFGLLPYFIIVFVQISSPWKHLHCALDLSRALLSRSQPFVFSLLYFFFVTLTTIFIQSIYRHIFLLSVSFIWNIRFMRIEILSGALRITIVLPIPRHSLNYVLVWNRLVFWHFGFFSSPLKFSSYAFTLQKQFPF